MSKLIVKSTCPFFNGLFFRKANPNSIEWTSLPLAAMVFEHQHHAVQAMVDAGVTDYLMVPAARSIREDMFTPSPSTGFVR